MLMAPRNDLDHWEVSMLTYQKEFTKLTEHSKEESHNDLHRYCGNLEQDCQSHLVTIDSDLAELQKLLRERPGFNRSISPEHSTSYEVLLLENYASLQSIHQQLVGLRNRSDDDLTSLKKDVAAKANRRTAGERLFDTWKSQLEELYAMEEEIKTLEQDKMTSKLAEEDSVSHQRRLVDMELEEKTLTDEIRTIRHQLEERENQRTKQAMRLKSIERDTQLLLKKQKDKDSRDKALNKLVETLGSVIVIQASEGELQLLISCHLESGKTVERKVQVMIDTSTRKLTTAKVDDVDVYINDIIKAAKTSDMSISEFLRNLKQRILVTEKRKISLKEIAISARCEVKMDNPNCVSATWPNQIVTLVDVNILWPVITQPLKIRLNLGPAPQNRPSGVDSLIDSLNTRLQTEAIDLQHLLQMIGEGLTNISSSSSTGTY